MHRNQLKSSKILFIREMQSLQLKRHEDLETRRETRAAYKSGGYRRDSGRQSVAHWMKVASGHHVSCPTRGKLCPSKNGHMDQASLTA